MSAKEDAILAGKAVPFVRPPTRSTDLSGLCAMLQEKLKADRKYVALYHQRAASDLFDTI